MADPTSYVFRPARPPDGGLLETADGEVQAAGRKKRGRFRSSRSGTLDPGRHAQLPQRSSATSMGLAPRRSASPAVNAGAGAVDFDGMITFRVANHLRSMPIERAGRWRRHRISRTIKADPAWSPNGRRRIASFDRSRRQARISAHDIASGDRDPAQPTSARLAGTRPRSLVA